MNLPFVAMKYNASEPIAPVIEFVYLGSQLPVDFAASGLRPSSYTLLVLQSNEVMRIQD